jgi:segregation and condensation protein B
MSEPALEDWSVDGAEVLLNPPAEAAFPAAPAAPAADKQAADVRSPEPAALLEALLFAGGPPLSAAAVGTVLQLNPADVVAIADGLNAKYRQQRRPYAVRHDSGGFTLHIHAQYAGLSAKLAGGPKEARLTAAATDTLALIAYRQPMTRSEIDAARGADSAGPLRQLVRLGLVATVRRAEPGSEPAYGTTPRFLEVFGLTTPDDLPRVGEARKL